MSGRFVVMWSLVGLLVSSADAAGPRGEGAGAGEGQGAASPCPAGVLEEARFEWEVRLGGGALEVWIEDWRFLGPRGGRPVYYGRRSDEDGRLVEERVFACVDGGLEVVAQRSAVRETTLGAPLPWYRPPGALGRREEVLRVALRSPGGGGRDGTAGGAYEARAKSVPLAASLVEVGHRTFRAVGTLSQLEGPPGEWSRELVWFSLVPEVVPLRWRRESERGVVEGRLLGWRRLDPAPWPDAAVEVDPKRLLVDAGCRWTSAPLP